MTRRRLLALAALTLSTLYLCHCQREVVNATPSARRVVSLAPAITETLFDIGAGARVVAVSDYCDSPEAATRLPRVGTSITPNYEAIARLGPDLILGEDNASARRQELAAVGSTKLLPWLTLSEITSSVRQLGAITGRAEPANALAKRLDARLGVPVPSHGPRVLLVLGGDGSANDALWFVRRNSLHGAALHGAGARNAVDEDIAGPPELSQERLLALDPPFIVVLSQPKTGAAPQSQHGFERYTTLSAVKSGHVARLETPDAFANGPRVLALVDQLHAALRKLGALP